MKVFTSSVGKKIVMSVTGLFLCTFLVVHLSGNFLLFKNDGGVAFNEYSKFMATNLLIRILEIGLLLGFSLHIIFSLILTLKNRSARPTGYTINNPSENSTWPSRNMGITGSIILIFLVVHMRTFFVDQRLLERNNSMYESVKLAFSNPYYSLFYIIAMILLMLHLNHGFQSAFQSLGLNHKKYTPFIEKLGLLFSIIVPIGFAIVPIYFYFNKSM